MGSSFSDLKEIEENSCANKFFDENEIIPADPFWNQLLSFSYIPNYSIRDNDIITLYLSQKMEYIDQNHRKLKNLYHIVNVFLLRSDELKRTPECIPSFSKDSIFLKQIYNGLFIIRHIVKIIIEANKLENIINNEFSNDDICAMRKLFSMLLSISIDVPINDATHFLHLEIILFFNIILNCDLYSEKAYLLQDFLFENDCSLHSQFFIKRLLENVVEFNSSNSITNLNQEAQSNKENNYVGSLWKIISFGYFGPTSNATDEFATNCLSSECVFLVLKLCLHSKYKDCYKKVLFSLHDPSLKNASDSLPDKEILIDSSLAVSFPRLLQVICSNFDQEHFVLLFYLLIHKNLKFRAYVLSLEQFQDIILPLLKLIYNYSSENSNSVYMALIILLIMTENSYFNSSVQRELISYLPWIKEKTMTNISIGSLIVWVLCRIIQYNFGYIGDRYIHINCLAALANMSSKFINLHPQASEQIMVLLGILLKRRTCISKNLKNMDDCQDSEKFSNLSNNLSVIEEILQMLVEIINTALIFSLNNNPHMIHTFLYHRKLFNQIKINSHTETHACNIDAILTYFSSKIDKELGKSVSSQTDVLNVIKKFSPSINKLNNFKRFPELKFKYIEQECSDDFFVPYIWKLVCKKSLIFYKHKDYNFSNIC